MIGNYQQELKRRKDITKRKKEQYGLEWVNFFRRKVRKKIWVQQYWHKINQLKVNQALTIKDRWDKGINGRVGEAGGPHKYQAWRVEKH